MKSKSQREKSNPERDEILSFRLILQTSLDILKMFLNPHLK